MTARAARTHHRVLDGDAAEANEELGVAFEHGPSGGPVQELAHRPHDVRHDHRLRAVAVRVLAPHVAAEAIQEPVQLALRMMESPRAAPAVGAAVDGLAAKSAVDATKLTGEHADGGLPAHRDEGFRSAARVRTWTAVEPAGSHHRLDDARRMSQAPDDVAEER